MSNSSVSSFGKWMALAAALLGWMFDGLEMGLFPLVARAALADLGIPGEDIPHWLGIITAFFLVGAATGGVLFGWLGDKIGRVRAMMVSVLTYALVSGLAGFAASAWQVGVLRFIAALGMGGEWSLGVALINEIWPARSRAFLAGLIGAAANVGYLTIALIGKTLVDNIPQAREWLAQMSLPSGWVDYLVSNQNQGWRLLMMIGALPALLTFFIRLCVPESARWESERQRGITSHWASRDLLGVLVGACGACGLITLWAVNLPLAIRIVGSLAMLVLIILGYTYPVILFLKRAAEPGQTGASAWSATLKTMLLAACLSGVALLGTWGTVQQAPPFMAEQTQNRQQAIFHAVAISRLASAHGPLLQAAELGTWDPQAKNPLWAAAAGPAMGAASSRTQIWGALGAILGTIVAALVADWLGRRVTYSLLCLGSLIIVPTLFLTSTTADGRFLVLIFLAGAITASFYGWLPLYLPELFPTRMRATGQGFGFNFGRVIAAVGVLQLGNLKDLMKPYGWGLAEVCSVLSLIYLAGIILIWFAPETKGKPLPE